MFVISLVASAGSITCFMFEPYLNINTRLFLVLFGCFELFIAGRMAVNAYRAYNNDKKLDLTPAELVETAIGAAPKLLHRGHVHRTKINILQNPKTLWKALPLFFVAGFLATFLGIGGGPINAPVLYEIVLLPICNATAGSTTVIFFNSIVNLLMYGIRGEIDWVVGAIMGVGMMVGAFIGAQIASKVPRWATLGLLAILMVIAGGKMIAG